MNIHRKIHHIDISITEGPGDSWLATATTTIDGVVYEYTDEDSTPEDVTESVIYHLNRKVQESLCLSKPRSQ